MDRLLAGMVVAALVVALVTWVLVRYASRRRWVPYLPAGIAWVLGIHQVVVARTSPGFEALARGLLAVLLLSGAVGGTVTAVAMEVHRHRARRGADVSHR